MQTNKIQTHKHAIERQTDRKAAQMFANNLNENNEIRKRIELPNYFGCYQPKLNSQDGNSPSNLPKCIRQSTTK